MLWGLGTLRPQIWLGGEIGILAALKMLFPDGSAGSIPAPSTKKIKKIWIFTENSYLCKTKMVR